MRSQSVKRQLECSVAAQDKDALAIFRRRRAGPSGKFLSALWHLKFCAPGSLDRKTLQAPEHVAAAVFALAAGDLSLTTGMHIPVDSGVAAGFLR